MLKLVILVSLLVGFTLAEYMTITQTWPGHFKGVFKIHVDVAVKGWKAHLVFDKPVQNLQSPHAQIISSSSDGQQWIVGNMGWNSDVGADDYVTIDILGEADGDAPRGTSFIEGQHGDPGSNGTVTFGTIPTTQSTTWGSGNTPSGVTPGIAVTNCDVLVNVTNTANITKYDYGKAIAFSILFYEAQRSGKLPANNRITWRSDSALNDGKDAGLDLSGGWYDVSLSLVRLKTQRKANGVVGEVFQPNYDYLAGDNVKFSLPMASTTTLLLWGLIQYKDAYEASGQLDFMYDSVKWPLDYFIKCHDKPNELYVQVGDGGADHGFWGRPEDMTMARPSYKVDATHPGADVAGETAAAMAAGYIAFKERDPDYAAILLTHAKQLYEFADKNRGKYTDTVSAASGYYRSSHFLDELAWAACWLHLATGDDKYVTAAETLYPDVITEVPWALSWDDKKIGVETLLYNITGKDKYKTDIQTALKSWLPGGSWKYTPRGLAYRDKWGPIRYATNGALIALINADNGINPGIYRSWAEKEVNYALGDAGHSYVVGFGVNPPKKPHHRSSSCPTIPAKCDWAQFNSASPNPQTLCGALVGGPDESDTYSDDRKNYVSNEVACDYNGGYQSTLAGLLHLGLTGKLPNDY